MIRRVHHHPHHHREDSYSSESSSDLFSPIHARRVSLHQNTPDTPDNDDNDVNNNDDNKTLPRLHNTSWIGARVSPIPSIDEDEENDLLLTAPYRKAIQQQQQQQEGYSSIAAYNTTERTFLMPGSDPGGVGGAAGNGHHPMISTKIHPLWNQGTPPLQQRGRRRRQQQLYEQQQQQQQQQRTSRFACIVIVVTGIHLSCIGIHDFYLWYLSYRRDIEPKYSLAWNLPWLTPSSPRTLSRFGVFIPLSVIQQDGYWRSLTSLSTTTSVVEWTILAWIWGRELKTADGSVWPIIFILSCLTGQLWMVAFHRDGISGCASWGTGGCACAFGVKTPNSRFELFLFSIALLLVNLFQPYSSVYGAIGGIFFGWCCHGIGLAVQPPVPDCEENLDTQYKKHTNNYNNGCIGWVATVAVIKLWTIPIAYLIWKTFFAPSMNETSS